jgi:O-antigen/teichoic acid export membrane protein
VLLLRTLSVESFAFIVLLLNVGQFVGSAVTGGIRLRYTRLEAERVSRGESEPSAFHATLLTGSAMVVAAAILGLLGATVLGIGQDADGRLLFVGLGTAYTLAHAATDLATFHFQAQLSFVRGGLVQVARSAALLVAAVAATAGLLESSTEVGVAFAVGAGAVALAIAGPLAIATRSAAHNREGRFGFGKESAALTLYSLSSSGWAYLDLFLVAALLNDVAVASYGAALRYVSLMMGPVPALVAVVRIRTAQKDLVDSEGAQIEMMARWAKQTALPAFAILGAGAIGAFFAIPLIDGGRYPLSVPIFQILLVGAFAKFVTLPSSSLLITQERYTTLAWVNAAAVVVNVGLAAIAATLFGVVGIAVAGVAVTVLQVLSVTWLAANPRPRDPVGAARPPVPAGQGTSLEA